MKLSASLWKLLLDEFGELFRFRDGHDQPLSDQSRQIVLNTIRWIFEPRPHFANRHTEFTRSKPQMARQEVVRMLGFNTIGFERIFWKIL